MNGIKHEYILDGSCIVAEKWVENNVEYMMVFLYDDAGSPIGFLYRTSAYARGTYDAYFYEKNFFGDVIGIYDESGTKVAGYLYNAWGVCTVQTNVGGIATLNPIRYRGYYYDTHTGLYYLQSRYYNPEWGRFISMDDPGVLSMSPDALSDKNLYIYCDNNPVMRVDEDGEFWNILIGAGFGAIVGAAVSAVSQLLDETDSWQTGEFWAHVGIAAGAGAISGGLAASGVLIGGQVAVNAALGGLSSIADTTIEGNASVETYMIRAAEGVTFGAIGATLGGAGTATKHVSNHFWRMVKSGGKNMSYYFSQINCQAVRDGLKAIPGILKAAIPSASKTFIKSSVSKWR